MEDNGSTFINNKIEEYLHKFGRLGTHLPLKPEGSEYLLDDLKTNNEQEQIVYLCIKKIKEWLEFPNHYKQNNTVTFSPLYMTIQGVGGSGKTFLMNVLISTFKRMFEFQEFDEHGESIKKGVTTVTAAPTGAAAFKANGKTCHSLFGVNFNNYSQDLSKEKKSQLLEDFIALLLLCIDERSMLSSKLIASMHKNAVETVHGESLGEINFKSKKLFGGIPIILLIGDDCQLPPVIEKGIIQYFQFTENIEDKTQENIETKLNEEKKFFEYYNTKKIDDMVLTQIGSSIFLECAKSVVELKQIPRLDKEEKLLPGILRNIRTGGCSKQDTDILMNLHISNVSHRRKKYIEQNAIYLFAKNKGRIECNTDKFHALSNPGNPALRIPTKYSTSGFKGDMYKHFKNNNNTKNVPLSTIYCVGATIALTCNIFPQWGLFKGAIGKIKGIRFRKKDSSDTQHDVLYVVVEMNDYCGPKWIENDIPLSITSVCCMRSTCQCYASFIPTTISFGRTIHTFQGQEVGPNKKIKCMVIDVGDTKFESLANGILYTGISRTSDIGNGNPEKSSLYFAGNLTRDRLQNLHYKRSGKKEMYQNIRLLKIWSTYLSKNIIKNDFNDLEKIELKKWNEETQIKYEDLLETIHFHKHHEWKTC